MYFVISFLDPLLRLSEAIVVKREKKDLRGEARRVEGVARMGGSWAR